MKSEQSTGIAAGICLKSLFLLILVLGSASALWSQNPNGIHMLKTTGTAHPLEELTVLCNGEGTITVTDGNGREYLKTAVSDKLTFTVGGAAGTHKISFIDRKGKVAGTADFFLEANTAVDDGGKFNELFNILYNGMLGASKNGVYEMKWNGEIYKFYVTWDLDNSNVMNGIQYFLPYGNGLTDLLRETQRSDGMIWSSVREGNHHHYYKTAYEPIGFFKRDNDLFFFRQPVDNHSDYCYVNMFYKHWKASGNSEWMKKTLPSAALALDYCYTDSIRWSDRFGLLKRPYCIDSWDFQVDDEYTPEAPISPTMVIVPGKTKYGIFFGDNTGYFEACNQLAEMYEFIGEPVKAAIYRKRSKEIMDNLVRVSWNGKYFMHFIDEDSTVRRNLGVDEKSQIAQSNMYSINRGLPHEMNVAIINTYLDLKENLPAGSPGEWYAIYPPFERGFGSHGDKWQYMNGGVAGHAIGELARGAYENGFEDYATDILNRLLELGKKYNNSVYFSYTGSIPAAPEAPEFKPVDISTSANMDLLDIGGKDAFKWMNDAKPGNDMRGLPVGLNTFEGIPFKVIDPGENQRRASIAVSVRERFPAQAEIPINSTAGSVYLLHSISGMSSGRIAGAITFLYDDGTSFSKYLFTEKDVTNWWFPSLNSERSGIAWAGPNLHSSQVGVCWAAIDNPNPSKKIHKIRFNAPLEGGIYAVLGVSLSDKPHYTRPEAVSFGGPDNWAAANGMAALIEGLAGIKNESLAYENVLLSPRWTSAGIDSVHVTAKLAASGGYVSYNYNNDPEKKEISILVTGSGKNANAHVLLPENALKVKILTINGKQTAFSVSSIENSKYADFEIELDRVQEIVLAYE